MSDKPENKDALAEEVSIGLEVSAGGSLPVNIKGKARSRFISAADRLLGNIVDYPNAWLEAAPAKKRAETAMAIKQIENASAAIEQIAEQKGVSEQFVRQAVAQTVAQAVRNQEKKILLLQEAVEDLKQRPLNEEEADNSTELDEGFLNRLEKRTEEATEIEIREKWAKVLAGEIRKPRTFSPKVMRIIDEIESAIALLFRDICQYRMANAIPVCLAASLMSFTKERDLEGVGLILTSAGNALERAFREWGQSE